MSNTTGLNVILSPMYESIGERVRPCANVIITYDNNKVNLDDTVYTYYFDDKPVKSFLDVLNPSTGVHNFKVVVSYKGETKIANADLKYSKYKKFKVSDSNEPIKIKKNKSVKPFISRKRFPFATAEYGQVYYTNTIKVYNRSEGNREEAQEITNTFGGEIEYYVIYDSSTTNTNVYNKLDTIPKYCTILSVILTKKKFIIKYNDGYIHYNELSNNYYPNAAFRTLVDPPILITSKSLYKFAICYNVRVTKKINRSAANKGYVRTPYTRWKRYKTGTKNKNKLFSSATLLDLFKGNNIFNNLRAHKSVYKIRIESNSGNASNWAYYIYVNDNYLVRVDKHRKRNNHVTESAKQTD